MAVENGSSLSYSIPARNARKKYWTEGNDSVIIIEI